MNKIEPRTVAKWFMQQNLDIPKNSFSGNTKLQKLLFFAQLIYMYQNNNETMYNQEFNAFEHGMVLEDVRQEYCSNFNKLNLESKEYIQLPEDIEKSLKLTRDIFGSYSPDELSEMSHQFKAWNKYFRKSMRLTANNMVDGFNKNMSKVPYDELKEELYKIEKVLNAYESSSNLKNSEDY